MRSAAIGDLAGYTYGIVGERDRDEDARLAALTPRRHCWPLPARISPRPTCRAFDAQREAAAEFLAKKHRRRIDNFSNRVPNGPIVEPADIRAQSA